MGEVCVELRRFKQAEKHFAVVAVGRPGLLIELATLRERIGNKSGAKAAAAEAERLLRVHLSKNPSPINERIQLSQLVVARGDLSEAEAILKGGVDDAPEMIREARVKLYKTLAVTLERQSPLYRTSSLGLVSKAFLLGAEDSGTVRSLLRLSDRGESLAPGLKVKLQTWVTELKDPTPLDEIVVADIQIACNKPALAIQSAERAATRDGQLQEQLIRVLRATGQQDRADRIAGDLNADLRQQLTESPGNTRARYRLANLLLAREANSEALSILNGEPEPRSRAWNATAARAYRNLAQDQSTAADEQLAAFESALRLAPTSPSTLGMVVNMLTQNGPLKESAKAMVTSSIADGQIPPNLGYTALGSASLTNGDFADAVSRLAMAAKLNGNNPMVWNNLALALVRSKPAKIKPASEAINRALALVPGQPELLVTRGEIAIAAKDWPDAIRSLSTALRSKSGERDVHLKLAEAYEGLGAPVLAKKHTERANELTTSPQAH